MINIFVQTSHFKEVQEGKCEECMIKIENTTCKLTLGSKTFDKNCQSGHVTEFKLTLEKYVKKDLEKQFHSPQIEASIRKQKKKKKISQ